MIRPVLAFPLLVAFAWLVEKHLLVRLIARFDRSRSIFSCSRSAGAWGWRKSRKWLGLSYEIGAFVAGVSIARSPIALFIAESLKPLRDFFLVIFFVALGAGFNLAILPDIWLAALGPQPDRDSGQAADLPRADAVFEGSRGRATEVAIRLGQMSEFSLLLALMATELAIISRRVSYLIQVATLASFLFSSYYVVARFPTPIALRRQTASRLELFTKKS